MPREHNANEVVVAV